MSEPKPFASLTPSLLARKGGARPAMRPQLQPMQQFHEATARQIDDDLGWNDLGHDLPAPASVAAPVPAAPSAPAEVIALHGDAGAPPLDAVPVPDVVRQQEAIAQHVGAAAAARIGMPAPARPRRSALAQGRRAAFTLRLDAERHLQLRLACTLANRSAQQMVTEALDRLLAELPDVATLAAHVKSRP